MKTISELCMEGYELNEVEVSSLEEKQALVKGNLDCKSLTDGIDIWFNDEFLFTGEHTTTLVLQNKKVPQEMYINGPVFLAGVTPNGGTVSLSDEQKRWVEENILYYPFPSSDRKLLVIHGYES